MGWVIFTVGTAWASALGLMYVLLVPSRAERRARRLETQRRLEMQQLRALPPSDQQFLLANGWQPSREIEKDR